MSARGLCYLSSRGARRCGVMMQHLRYQGSSAADPDVSARDLIRPSIDPLAGTIYRCSLETCLPWRGAGPTGRSS